MSSENIKFQEMLKEVTKDILSEDSLVHIQEAFDSAVQERVDLHVETALVEQDDSYANKLTKLLEAVDIDHCSKLERLVEAIDTNHAQKLQLIVNKYKSALNNEAVNLKESLVDNISNYLELYVDKAIPKEQLTEAVSNKRSKSVLQELRQVLAVDSMLAKDTVKSAIQDGKRQIVESTTKVSKLHTENKNLKETLNRAQAELILERKALGLPERKKQYVMRVLQDKSAQFITENFDYTVKLFEKEDDNIRTQLKEQATTTRAVKKQNVDVIVEQVKPVTNQPTRKESASNLDDDHDDSSSFDTYMGELGKY
tara:strand:+ start:9587 stop:10522 length:936 start_codon:yes stop_codon:yes gene_type:complete